MNPDDGSEAGSIAEPLPQEQITMLLNVQDFQEKVAQDPANLCCVIVTSTLCRHCGIRRIPARAGHFYRDIEEHLVHNRDTATQRRHTRFFHVCACMEEETCVDFLIAADPAYSLLNKQPTAHEMALLHKKAHHQLKELLNLLEVRSTPSMRLYLAGQPLRYSAMLSSCNDAAAPKDVTAETDVLQVSGANWIKWFQVLQNAVVVRNEVMRSYDTEEREKARAARAEARRQARREHAVLLASLQMKIVAKLASISGTRRLVSDEAVTSVHENGLTSDDLLLLCGVKPGSSKALWYTTMRAQLEARALATAAEQSDRGDSATSNRPRTGVGSSSSSSHSLTRRADASSEPLVLPTALLLLTEPSDLNAHTMGAPESAAQQKGKIPRTRSGEDDAEKVEEDDGASSLGTRSTSLCSEKVANASVTQGAPNAVPLVPLKKLRLSPKQLTQMRVSVLSLQALADL
ncbi:hypothetical protein CGC21_26565 [Leishmania donovani]|uniref:Uncharacterized protein n=1 Tax=Leishmania donovani TaxID=5661 RepID=A0A504WZL8_LEIDO|nr:hypothetical protein CGC21_26565 [Leishmania donovani]